MKRSDWLLALALAAVAFATRLALRYGDGFGDNNVIHMATGMARGVAFDAALGDTLQYGKNFSLGVYLLFRALYPLFFDGAGSVVAALNWTGVAASFVLYPALYAVYRFSLSARAASIACVLVMSAPVVWENETYFQPISLAFASLLLAVLAIQSRALRQARLPLATLCLLVSLSLRAEVALMIPGLVVWAFRGEGRRRATEAAVVAAVALGLLAALLVGVGGGEGARGTSLPEYITRYFQAFVRARAIARNLFWAALGIGLVSAGTGLALGWQHLRNRTSERASFLLPGGMALFVLLFWVSNSVPLVRHFYLMVPPLAFVVGRAIARRRYAYAWLALVLTLNLAFPELIYASLGGDRVAHGSLFSAHAAQQSKVSRARAFAVDAADRLIRLDASPEPARVAMPVNWTLFGYLEHELTVRGVALREIRTVQLDQGVTIKEFAVGPVVLRQIRTNWSGESAIASVLSETMAASAEQGWQLWIPMEFEGVLPPKLENIAGRVRL